MGLFDNLRVRYSGLYDTAYNNSIERRGAAGGSSVIEGRQLGPWGDQVADDMEQCSALLDWRDVDWINPGNRAGCRRDGADIVDGCSFLPAQVAEVDIRPGYGAALSPLRIIHAAPGYSRGATEGVWDGVCPVVAGSWNGVCGHYFACSCKEEI